MWAAHGLTEIPYVVEDIERELGAFTGDDTFAGDFFDRFVRGSDLPDYESLLGYAGLLLRPRAPGNAYLGQVQLRGDDGGMTIVSGTSIGSPLYEAGLDRGDMIGTIAGRPIVDDADWQATMAAHAPGDEVEIVFETRGTTRTGRIRFATDARVEVVTYESFGMDLSVGRRAFRDAWMGSLREER